jgi:hypothetical protein
MRMQASQTPLLLHDDAEALALIERIKWKLAQQQDTPKKSPEREQTEDWIPRFVFAKNLC